LPPSCSDFPYTPRFRSLPTTNSWNEDIAYEGLTFHFLTKVAGTLAPVVDGYDKIFLKIGVDQFVGRGLAWIQDIDIVLTMVTSQGVLQVVYEYPDHYLQLLFRRIIVDLCDRNVNRMAAVRGSARCENEGCRQDGHKADFRFQLADSHKFWTLCR